MGGSKMNTCRSMKQRGRWENEQMAYITAIFQRDSPRLKGIPIAQLPITEKQNTAFAKTFLRKLRQFAKQFAASFHDSFRCHVTFGYMNRFLRQRK